MKTQPVTEVKKSKKEFILDFLDGNKDITDKVKAFETYNAVIENPNVSSAFFNKCWQEVKGHTPKAVKVAKDQEGIREQIGRMFTEQQEMQKVVSKYHVDGLLTNDPEKKKELKALEDAAFDKVMAFNRTIRAFMESNNQ